VPAASPILLFYALSQAGRAVCAAQTSGQPWQSRGHGLSIGNPGKPLGETVVRPEGGSDSSFAMFCKALKAPPLSESTTLGALWAANKNLESVEGLGLGFPPALELTVIGPSYIGGPSLHAQLGGDLAANLPADSAAAAIKLGERLYEYPGAATGLVVNAQGTSITPRGTEPQVEIGWLDGNGKPIPVDQIAPDKGNFLRPRHRRSDRGSIEYRARYVAMTFDQGAVARELGMIGAGVVRSQLFRHEICSISGEGGIRTLERG
jgi:hypothetical protein